MKPELLCMGCMYLKGTAAVCPQCRYSDRGPENPQQLPPRTILKRKYVIGRALGQGGFGITYLACDLEVSSKLAIKEYFPVQISTRAQDHLTLTPIGERNRHDLNYGLARFAEEGKALAQFKDYPGVVSMLDFLYANGTAYIVMAYVDGHDLKEHLHRHGGRLLFDAALKIMLPVMAALESVHRAHIVHRDISPDNIYVESDGGIKILDFGATRYAMGEQSRSLSVVLKPGYAPEEQYRAKGKQGTWTDIYALGATFYRAITGQVPPEALDRLVEDELIPPSTLGVAIPPNCEAALMKALAVRAENRFQSVVDFRDAVTPPRAVVRTPVITEPSADPAPQIQHPAALFQNREATQLPKGFLLTVLSFSLLALFIAAWQNSGSVQFVVLLILFTQMIYLFHRMWSSIQDGHARTTAHKAVGYCFIPLFNFYWAFPVWWGFAQDYNRYRARHSGTGVRLSENMFLFSSFAYVVAWIALPFGIPTSLFIIAVNALFLLPLVAVICDAVNGLTTVAAAQKIEAPGIPPQKSFVLYCISGDHQGNRLAVNNGEVIIGRNPALSNVVLSSEDISGHHVRVWPDCTGAGIWIEDLKSRNGTFYRQSNFALGDFAWIQLTARKLLRAGDRFRLSEDGAEFEIEEADTKMRLSKKNL